MSKKYDNTQKNQRIQVFARCRPLNTIEKNKGSPSIVEVIPDKKVVVKDRNANREFLFDKVFSPDTKQISVYKAVVEPLIQEVLMGYNCTVFAYGQTGTGKTYTMEGERTSSKCSWEDDPKAGIIPRSLHQLFENLNKEENVEFSVRVSFLELYNEELFDLLSSTELSKLRLLDPGIKRGSANVIQGLEEILVNNKDEVYAILEKGTARRQTAATLLNASSSRSHTVFSVTVHIKENTVEGEELLKTGKLNLVDLAGSENVGRSGAVDKRAREAGNINQSLLTLGRVITALIEKQPHIPYRESKLTRLLQDSLGGHTKTSIIATISPAACNLEETISTLDYATKAKSITINPEVNQKMTKRALIKEYTEEIERLRKDLVALRTNEGFYIDKENYQNLTKEIESNKEIIKDLSEKIEFLMEEKAKIEEMFNSTKEELCVTNDKLSKTCQKYEETASELSNTVNVLNYTKEVLTKTTLERDENKFLINVHANTEKKLAEQAQQLILIADETTNDVDKLHAKIGRKDIVEKTNEEKCLDYRGLFHKQIILLHDEVSSSEKEQESNLIQLKQYFDKLVSEVQSFKNVIKEFLKQLLTRSLSSLGEMAENYVSEYDSNIKWSEKFLEDIDVNEIALSHQKKNFRNKDIPKLINQMNQAVANMEKWFVTTQNHLTEKVENAKEILRKKSFQSKQLLNSIQENYESSYKCFDEKLKDIKKESAMVFAQQNELDTDVMEFLEKYNIRKEKIKESMTKLNTSVEEVEITVKNLQNTPEHVKSLHSIEDNHEMFLVLDDCSSTFGFSEFSENNYSIVQSQKDTTSQILQFLKEHEEMQQKIASENKLGVENHKLVLSKHQECGVKKITELKASIESSLSSGEYMFNTFVSDVQEFLCKVQSVLEESKKSLNSNTNKVKEEILKRDVEFERFVCEELVKDIPTGTTPQRKNYYYPRLLAATSPHERILERFRSKLAADTEIALNLPLESSFNELDELKESPESNDKGVDLHNLSFSSEESIASCDTDSCASSMSDISVNSNKNKENKIRTKKASRLPRKLPDSKVFVKPSIPRKPLVSPNFDAEHHA